jgi:hypothetical protein
MKINLLKRLLRSKAANLIAAFLMLNSANAATVYWNNDNGYGDRSWSDDYNWNGGSPTSMDNALIMGTEWNISLDNMPIVNTANNFADQIYVRRGAGISITTNGSLLAKDLITGLDGNSNVVDISGGLLTLTGILNLGAGGYDGKVNISNGSLVANSLSINTLGGAGINIGQSGTFVIEYTAANLNNINYWIGVNAITADGGTGIVNVNTTTYADKIVLSAIPEPSIYASFGIGLITLLSVRNFNKKRI